VVGISFIAHAKRSLGEATNTVLRDDERNRFGSVDRYNEQGFGLDRTERECQPLSLKVGKWWVGTPLQRAGHFQVGGIQDRSPPLSIQFHAGKKSVDAGVIACPRLFRPLGVVFDELLAEPGFKLPGVVVVAGFLELFKAFECWWGLSTTTLTPRPRAGAYAFQPYPNPV